MNELPRLLTPSRNISPGTNTNVSSLAGSKLRKRILIVFKVSDSEMSTEVIKVAINGKQFDVPKGARLIDVCRDNAFDIPSFCYYADLALQASCRMCLVRIEKMPKLQTSCTIICTDGM